MIASPALTGEAISVMELYAAVLVCSSQYGYTPNLRPPKGWRRWKLRYTLRRYSFEAEAKKFFAYLADFDSGPKFWPDENAGNPEGPQKCADIDQVLESTSHVIKETGWSEDVVWNLALGKLRWYSSTFVKLSGQDVPFWTPQDEEAYKRHVAQREAKLQKSAEEMATKEGVPFEEALKKVKTEYWDGVKKAKMMAKLQAKL
jgi:hypothetical protein